MNIIRLSLVGIFILQASICCIAQVSTDSLKTTTLKELVVESDSEFTNATVTTYIVGKNQKKHAADGIQLLQMMNISQALVDPINRSVTSTSGEPVALFINGLPAEQEDIDNLFCKDAIKVEYIVNSPDPRYLGHKNVVNYVMQKYEYGGYTRLKADVAGFREYEYGGSIYSKFNYKRMTYDVSAFGKYADTKRIKTENTDTYLLTDNDGNVQEVERKLETLAGKARIINKTIPNASFRATYLTDKITIRNQIGMAFYDYPVNRQAGKIEVRTASPSVGRFEYNSPLVNRDFNWNGYYLFSLPKGYSLTMTPSFTYSRNTNWSEYVADAVADTKIVNNFHENVYKGLFIADAAKVFSGVHNVSLHYDAGVTGFKTQYSGNTNYSSSPLSFAEALSLTYTYTEQKWNVRINPDLDHEYRKTPDGSKHLVSPRVFISGAFSPNSHHRLSLQASYARELPALTNSEDIILQLNEFFYRKSGDLKPEDLYGISGSWWFSPCNAFNMSLAPNYEFSHNTRKYEYVPYDGGHALLRTTFNNGDMHKFFVSIMANLRLLDNKLSVMVYPRYNMWRSTGYDAFTKHNVYMWMYATYFLGHLLTRIFKYSYKRI